MEKTRMPQSVTVKEGAMIDSEKDKNRRLSLSERGQ